MIATCVVCGLFGAHRVEVYTREEARGLCCPDCARRAALANMPGPPNLRACGNPRPEDPEDLDDIETFLAIQHRQWMPGKPDLFTWAVRFNGPSRASHYDPYVDLEFIGDGEEEDET